MYINLTLHLHKKYISKDIKKSQQRQVNMKKWGGEQKTLFQSSCQKYHISLHVMKEEKSSEMAQLFL